MSAVISVCGKYRYRLDREIDPSAPGRVLFIGINPSTADADLDDATVRKWKGFVSRWPGYGRFSVANVFAYRSTDPKVLAQVDDPVGPYNINHLVRLISGCDLIVPCWGRLDKVPKALQAHVHRTMVDIINSGRPSLIFGRTKCGQPLHPLMLPYDTVMVKP